MSWQPLAFGFVVGVVISIRTSSLKDWWWWFACLSLQLAHLWLR